MDAGLASETGTVAASDLITYLDGAGIRRALVLSVAHQLGVATLDRQPSVHKFNELGAFGPSLVIA
jgi:hypothetical protein